MPINSSELCAEVDSNNNVVACVARALLRSENLIHRATYIYAYDSNCRSQLLVQRRTALKDYCPNMLDACFGGVVAFGESYRENAERELEEEIGLPSALLKPTGIVAYYGDDQTRVFGEVYVVALDRNISELKIEVEEVASVTFMKVDDVLNKAHEFTPDSIFFLRLLRKMRHGFAETTPDYREIN